MRRYVFVLLLFGLVTSTTCAAQAPQGPTAKQNLTTGDRSIRIFLPKDTAELEIVFERREGDIETKKKKVSSGDTEITVEIVRPLEEGDIIVITAKDGRGNPIGGATQLTIEPHQEAQDDERNNFEASAFLGTAVDNFASTSLKNLLNPDEGNMNDPKVRGIFGFDFAYRLAGSAKDERQLWVYGESVHGVRSADVDCMKNPRFQACVDNDSLPDTDPNKILGEAVFILRNATSLEAFTGFRYEFKTLNGGGEHAGSVYVKGQAGFLTVKGSSDDLIDSHHVGLGVIITEGPFVDTYLELGMGKTDLFADHRNRRFKIDVHLSRRIKGALYFFAQMTVDTDLGNGSDSVQTYFGFDFDLGELFGNGAAGAD